MLVLADVIANCYVAVGIATFDHKLYQKVYHCYYFFVGRCYCHVADVITTVFVVRLADVIAWWLMECLPWVWVADVIAKVADGIATGSMFQF